MMDYEMFKTVVREKFLSYLPLEYGDAEINISPARKVNRTMDGLSIYKSGDTQIFPTIYVEDMYRHYQSCNNLEAVLRQSAGKYAEMQDRVKEFKTDFSMEHFKDNVVMCLVNTEQNRELLADVPNRAFHDLSVIYRWVIEGIPDAAGSVMVTDSVAKMAGVTEEELFRCASENTRRINPVSIITMQELLFEAMSLPPELKSMFVQKKSPGENMWIITNENRYNGAVSMLYEENLHELAEKLGDDLFILPSSIHEVIAVPAGMAEGNPAYLAEMVHDVNMGEVELEERLSNSVYHYDRNARKVTLAAESPEKRLDGKQTEQQMIQEDKRQR